MLESVSGAGTDEQDVVHLRVKIDQQIAVGAVLILANSSFAERTASERGKTPDHEGADIGQRLGRRDAIPSVGVHGRPMGVVGDLEAAAFQIRKAVRSEEHTSELQSLMRNSYAV